MSEAGSYNAEDRSYDQLVAYLDGELDAESSLLVERRLAEDEKFRRELRQLQSTWDMLDELPKSEVSESFTQTTIEMLVLEVQEELEERKETVDRTNRLWWFMGGCGLIGTALVSYWIIAALLAQPNEQLVKDLPVIEDIELYRVAESVDFLRQLDEAGLFDEEVEDAL